MYRYKNVKKVQKEVNLRGSHGTKITITVDKGCRADKWRPQGKLTCKIDLFINDNDHSASYEIQEYELVNEKLSPKSIILGDNIHVTDKLSRFSREKGRNFIFIPEKPKDHWYPGSGIGVSFPRNEKIVIK